MTATISVQAVVPIENPAICFRPRIVPSAIASSRKTSGAVETIHLIVSIGALLSPSLPQGRAGAGQFR